MVSYTTKPIAYGKVNMVNGEDHSLAGSSSNTSSSSSSSQRTFYDSDSDEDKIDRPAWPSRREDCEWIADKVKLASGGMLITSTPRSIHTDKETTRINWAPASRRKHRSSRKKTVANSVPVVNGVTKDSKDTTKKRAPRQPLRDITVVTNQGAESPSSFRPACTIPPGWHRVLSILLTQAESDRDASMSA